MNRVAPTLRPPGAARGFQRWHRLLFSHWEVPASVLRPLVPARLTLDSFEGRCFVGVVAFSMQNVRPWRWAPSIPTATTFGEINLRTYVHLDGAEPGVFFFSLDAASRLVVWGARTFWGLPYFHAQIAIDDAGPDIRYRARRGTALEFSAAARIGAPLPAAGGDSLEFFLCERYQFYSEHRGRLSRARVHHAPYALYSTERSTVTPTLLDAAGLPIEGTRTADLFSPGVDADIFAIQEV
jgi:uncharacterized protein YqjF (DUF2071 family)